MITLLAIGKVKKSYVKEAMAVFQTRLTKYCNFWYKEVSEFKERDLKGFIVALDTSGTSYSSEDFAEFVQKTTMANKDITFIIGGPTGIPKDILKKANAKISLSKMTFPNEFVRAIFLEQLYRAFTIIKGEKYHK